MDPVKKKYIIDNVKNIKNDANTLNKEEIFEKYNDFIKIYPKIFYTALEDNLNISELLEMMDFIEKSKNLSKFDRDSIISMSYAKKYIYPKLGKEPSREELLCARKKIMKKHDING
jgi:hypothetical protein